MAAITQHEEEQVEAANASDRTPVVFVHGLWLLPSSWDRWAALFEEAGFIAVAPGWPDDPETVEQAKAHPEVLAHKTVGQVADHYSDVIGKLKKKPAVLPNVGGSLPNDVFSETLSLPTIWVPHSYPGCSQHAPNEHFPVALAREALAIMAGLYWDIGAGNTPAGRA